MAPILSGDERRRVSDAIAAAEASTSGEIFVVVAEASDDYRFLPLIWATLAALVVPLPLLFFTALPASLIYALQLSVFVVLAIVLSLPPVHPHIVPAGVKRGRASALAAQQFLAHGLHTTEARTGVLIFLSLTERHAEIVADTGIAARVDQKVWEDAVAALVAAAGDGRTGDGLVAAVAATGAVLAEHYPYRPGDRDELPNEVVLI